jgi:putative addiction module killer protein
MELRRYLTKAKIVARIDRLSAGNFGDAKALRDGLFELRIDWGPGYRVYYALVGNSCVLLLYGGISANRLPISSVRWNTSRTTRKGHYEAQAEHIS